MIVRLFAWVVFLAFCILFWGGVAALLWEKL